ncbi:MAG: hypothetical protein ABIH92_02510 [Nanoarchaeota archaeon]
MNYLYHMVPPNMRGNKLHPLNVLKDIHPEVYAEAVKKYDGREELLSVVIPTLGCLWNDVLHLTAIDPIEVKKALKKAGKKNIKKRKWYEINPFQLKKDSTTVFLYKDRPQERKRRHDEDNFETFDPSQLQKYDKLPKGTFENYKKQISHDKKPLLFHLAPHILYHGSIPVGGCKIIDA